MTSTIALMCFALSPLSIFVYRFHCSPVPVSSFTCYNLRFPRYHLFHMRPAILSQSWLPKASLQCAVFSPAHLRYRILSSLLCYFHPARPPLYLVHRSKVYCSLHLQYILGIRGLGFVGSTSEARKTLEGLINSMLEIAHQRVCLLKSSVLSCRAIVCADVPWRGPRSLKLEADGPLASPRTS
jgi:hypothetical protein